MKIVIRQVAFYVAAAVVAFLIVESGYRVHLLYKDPRILLRAETLTDLPPIAAYTRSLWQYDADEGFRYTDRTGVFFTEVANGRIASCSGAGSINADGSPGISTGRFQDAQFKVALFGDSFSAVVDDGGRTWVNRLEMHLQAELGRSVHILNAARDGTGILQMFDIAAAELPQNKPDLAIIAFNTSLLRKRIWRVAKTVSSEPRALTVLYRTEDPDVNDPTRVTDTTILDSNIDANWCEKNKKGGELDQVGREIVDRYLRFRPVRYSAFTPFRSFFWNKISDGNAFYPDFRETFSDAGEIAKDQKLAADVRRIRDSGVPVMLVHLPYSSEVGAAVEFSDIKAERVVDAVSRTTGFPVHGLVEQIGPIDRPERMNNSPSDMHPTAFGMEIYAKAVSNLIMQSGEVKKSAHVE
jgi:hypothetical protein